MKNRQVVLRERPTGAISVAHFELMEASVAPLVDGEVLVRNRVLGINPSTRARINAGRSYTEAQAIGAVVDGPTAGEIVASRSADFPVGTMVVGPGGWQDYFRVPVNGLTVLRRVDMAAAPLELYLGSLGTAGISAWIGMHRLCTPKPGETVVISAASGTVGSVAGVMAREMGCQVIGISGGLEKCAHVRDALGLHGCLDYKAFRTPADWAAAVAQACPGGVDAYFENVGGWITDGVMMSMNDGARMALCGMISGYDVGYAPMARPDLILTRRLRLQGFLVSDFRADWPQAQAELLALHRRGVLPTQHTVSQGLESAPAALCGMLRGANLGRQLVALP
jgi:NADPH-dependent curcumin reductase CurA